VAFALATFVAAFLIVPPLFDYSELPKAAFLQVVVLLLLVAASLLPVWRTGAAADLWPPVAGPLLAVLAWTGASAAWALNSSLTRRVWLHWLAAAVAYALLFHLARRAMDLRGVLAAAFAAGLVVSLLGLGQAFFGWRFVLQSFPPAATFANKNMAAQFVIGVVPFALAVAAVPAARTWRIAVGGAVALQVAFVAVTRTRSAILGLLVAAMVVAWAWPVPSGDERRRRRLAVVLAAVVVAVGLGVAGRHWLAPPPPDAARSTAAAATSVQGRLAIWRNTLVMIREHPAIGVGLANHRLAYPPYARRAAIDPLYSPSHHLDYAHDDYLQLAAELGIVGVIGLGVLALGVARLARQAHAAARDAPEAALALAASASIAGLLTDAVFSFPAYLALPPWLLAVDVAVLACLARPATGAHGFLAAAPGQRVLVTLVAGFALGIVALNHARWLTADAAVARMREAETRGDWASARLHADRARSLHPARSDGWFTAGTAIYALGRPVEGSTLLAEAVRRAPHDFNALANLGFARGEGGDFAGAVDALRKANALYPGRAEIDLRLGLALEAMGDKAGALESYRRAESERPNDPRPPFHRGMIALQAGRPAEAEEALRTALRIDPRRANAHKALAVAILGDTGRREEALGHFREAIRLDPGIRDRAQIEAILAGRPGATRSP
jgi:tetratricopeptide (TPR) repeat protein